MSMVNVFAKNPDGTVKTKQPCAEADCNWPNWHVCPKRFGPEPERTSLPRVAAYRDNGWEIISERNKEEFAEIVRIYEEERMGIVDLAEKFSYSKTKITRILKDEEVRRGERIRRSHGGAHGPQYGFYLTSY